MFKTLAAATAAALTLACSTLPSAGLQINYPFQARGLTVLDVEPTQRHVPIWESVLSTDQITLLVPGGTSQCYPGETSFAGYTCFDAVLPGGEVIRLQEQPGTSHFPYIAGYVHEGARTITVERVRTANYLSCTPGRPGGCEFTYYTLIEQ